MHIHTRNRPPQEAEAESAFTAADHASRYDPLGVSDAVPTRPDGRTIEVIPLFRSATMDND